MSFFKKNFWIIAIANFVFSFLIFIGIFHMTDYSNATGIYVVDQNRFWFLVQKSLIGSSILFSILVFYRFYYLKNLK